MYAGNVDNGVGESLSGVFHESSGTAESVLAMEGSMDPNTRAFIDESAKSFVTMLCAPLFMLAAACGATVTILAFTRHAMLARDRPG